MDVEDWRRCAGLESHAVYVRSYSCAGAGRSRRLLDEAGTSSCTFWMRPTRPTKKDLATPIGPLRHDSR